MDSCSLRAARARAERRAVKGYAKLAVGQLVRVPDGRTGVLVLIRGREGTVRMPSGQQLRLFTSELKAVR